MVYRFNKRAPRRFGAIPKFVSAPTLFGLVENADHFDNPAAANIEENEMFVTWVVSGEASWIDKSVDNVIQYTVETELLTVVEQPPTDLKVTRTRYSIKKDHLKCGVVFREYNQNTFPKWKFHRV